MTSRFSEPPVDESERESDMFKTLSTSVIFRGVTALVVGCLALVWPGITVLALVVIFAVYAWAVSVVQLLLAFAGRGAGPVVRHLVLGLIDVAAGVIALAWPVPSALILVLVVASWAVIAGAVEVGASFRAHGEADARALSLLGGLVSVAFGVALFARPGMGAISLALMFGLFNLISGSWMVVRGLELRRNAASLRGRRNPAKSKAAV